MESKQSFVPLTRRMAVAFLGAALATAFAAGSVGDAVADHAQPSVAATFTAPRTVSTVVQGSTYTAVGGAKSTCGTSGGNKPRNSC